MKSHSRELVPGVESYSSIVITSVSKYGFIYFFNLHLGQGIITIPKLISKTGLLLSTLLLICIAMVNLITGSHVVEAMGIANACYRLEARRRKLETKHMNDPLSNDLRRMKSMSNGLEEEQSPLVHSSDLEDEKDESPNESRLLPEDYEIAEKFEMGTMANMFYTPVATVLYYIAICFYITGSLATMLVVIVKTLVVLVCMDSSMHLNDTSDVAINTANDTLCANYIPRRFIADSICFGDITQQETYYIILSIIAVLICPWAFFKFTASKYLQLTTNTMRNIAYGFMIGICISNLVMGQKANPAPPLVGFSELPALFGIATYCFKAQHSLPGVVTPMKKKRRILLMMTTTLIIIVAFNLLMSFTAMFWLSFDQLQDIYTLNFFVPFAMSYPFGTKVLSIIGYYIVVYPVFALSPIIPVEAIIMRENLKALTRLLFKEKWTKIKLFMFTVDHILLPTVVVTLPLAMAFATTDVHLLLSLTGGVIGIWIQYLIATTLLFTGKRYLMKRYKGKYENKHKSPFSHVFFLYFIIAWTVVSAVVVVAGRVLSFL